MDHELSPEELDALLGAYALDAVDDDERRAVEEHLRRSPGAEDEVAQLREAAAMLAVTGGPPPEGVWEQLEAKLDIPGDRRSPAPAVSSIDDAPSVRRVGRRRAWSSAVAAVVVVLLLVGGGIVIATRDSSNPEVSTAALARDARREPGARTATLLDDSGNTLATAVVLPDGRGYLTSSLPALPRGRTYQLWSVGGRDTVSVGVLGRDPSIVAFATAPGTASLALTAEAAGGVAAPTQAPLAVGDVRA